MYKLLLLRRSSSRPDSRYTWEPEAHPRSRSMLHVDGRQSTSAFLNGRDPNMKPRELGTIARTFAPFLGDTWRLVGSEFVRIDGDWAQIVGFNASRFDDQYIPRCCLEFLKMPGVATCCFAVQELQNSNRTQQWVGMSDEPRAVFERMTRQFEPPLLAPLSIERIRDLLSQNVSYWPHAYALCIMACERGEMEDAKQYLDAFNAATVGKPYEWVEKRRQELMRCIGMVGVTGLLESHLQTVRAEKMRALGPLGRL